MILKNLPELLSEWKSYSNSIKTSTLEHRSDQMSSGTASNQLAPIDPEFLETCYRLNYVVEQKSCFDGYEAYLKSKAPAISTTGFSTGQLACVRAVSESFEPLGLGGTIWGKAENMFNRYESECFPGDSSLILKRNALIDRAVRQYAHENVSALAANSKSLGFRPENFGYDPMELARRLPSNTPIDPSRLSTLIVFEIGRLQSNAPVH